MNFGDPTISTSLRTFVVTVGLLHLCLMICLGGMVLNYYHRMNQKLHFIEEHLRRIRRHTKFLEPAEEEAQEETVSKA